MSGGERCTFCFHPRLVAASMAEAWCGACLHRLQPRAWWAGIAWPSWKWRHVFNTRHLMDGHLLLRDAPQKEQS